MTTPILSCYGRLGSDPRTHITQSGKPMATASIAVTLDCRDDDAGATWWLSLVAFGTQVESLAKHGKGDMIGVFGRLQLSRWTGNDGQTKEQHQLIVDQLTSSKTVRPSGKRKGQQATTDQQRNRVSYAAQHPDAGTADFNDAIPF